MRVSLEIPDGLLPEGVSVVLDELQPWDYYLTKTAIRRNGALPDNQIRPIVALDSQFGLRAPNGAEIGLYVDALKIIDKFDLRSPNSDFEWSDLYTARWVTGHLVGTWTKFFRPVYQILWDGEFVTSPVARIRRQEQ